jgi:hypothetical protein
MGTMYYVVAGDSYFGFYVDEGRLAVARRGANFTSLTEVRDWVAKHEFDRIARCEPEHSQLISPEARGNGRKDDRHNHN